MLIHGLTFTSKMGLIPLILQFHGRILLVVEHKTSVVIHLNSLLRTLYVIDTQNFKVLSSRVSQVQEHYYYYLVKVSYLKSFHQACLAPPHIEAKAS